MSSDRSRCVRGKAGESYLPAAIVLVVLVAVVASLVALAVEPPGAKGRPVGTVSFNTEPAGAMAYLDGKYLGRTPVEVDGVEAGVHLVKFELGGMIPYVARREIAIATDEEAEVASVVVELAPAPTGSISVSSVPVGARVSLSGEFRGHTPIVIDGLSPGPYTVLVRSTNREPWTATANVVAEGKVELEAKLEDQILRFLLAAVENDPTNVNNYTDLGHYHFINDRLDDAIAAYGKGLELSYMTDVVTGDPRRHSKEIKKHLHWPGSSITGEFRTKMAEVRVKLAKQFPGNVVAARQTAKAFLAKGQAAEAVRVLAESVQHAPENAELKYELGRACLAAKDCNRGLASFEAALKLAPNDLFLRRRIAKSCIETTPLFRSSDDKRALTKLGKAVLREAIDRSVDRFSKATMLYDLGILYAQEGLLEHAAKCMDEAVTLGGRREKLALWQLDLGGVYARMGKNDKARELYQAVIEGGGGEDLKIVDTARKALEKLDAPGGDN